MLPAAIAIGKNHIGTMAGKLNGQMIADDAERLADRVRRRRAVEAFSVKPPLSRCGMPQANSTTSWPRATSPSGVGEHLAVLGGDDRGELGRACVEQLAERNRTRARRASEVSRHAGKAVFAAATTCSTSAAVARATRSVTSPVAGLVTSAKLVGAALEHGAVGPVVECLGHRWYPLSVQKMA